MRKLLLLTITLVFLQASAQLTQGNWLVGGTGQFSAYSNTVTNVLPSRGQNVKAFKISASPNIGYFLKDRFAIGLKPSLIWSEGKAGDAIASDGSIVGSGGRLNQIRFVVGPFTRYYFLAADNPYNILVEAAYQYGVGPSKPFNERQSILSAAVGPVIYFNSSVGLEFLLS